MTLLQNAVNTESKKPMDEFLGYHSEWNLGSPGGWDYQRTTQEIGAAVWARLNQIRPTGLRLNFSHPWLFPIAGFSQMLAAEHHRRADAPESILAVVAEADTLSEVTENINLVRRLNEKEGIPSVLIAPEELELSRGRVAHHGRPVSVIFLDFNTDVLLSLHRRHNLDPLLQAVRDGQVINPRGTEPINVKSMFEILSGSGRERFAPEIVQRTPWTRQFYPRSTTGPQGEPVADLIEWTRQKWEKLVLKPERGYSGKGVMVGGVTCGAEEAIEKALAAGGYIVQEKIPLSLWAEDVPEFEPTTGKLSLARVQTDFRCLVGPAGVFGFLGRYGGVPTNVGSGGGVQPLALLESEMTVREAVNRLNEALLSLDSEAAELVELQHQMAREQKFTYLLGPIKIALRPRILTAGHLAALVRYCASFWQTCLVLEKMWQAGELPVAVPMEAEELEIVKSQPWNGSAAVIASDGLFSFGAHLET